MTTATVGVEREKMETLYHKISQLPDSALTQVLDFIDTIVIDDVDEYEPNAETLAAMREAEHPEQLKSYASIEDMFMDIGVNVDR